MSHKTVPAALRLAGATVVAHVEVFDPGIKDIEWLPKVGARGWILITKDQMIRRRPIESNALKSSGVKAFVMTAANLNGQEQAALLVKCLPKMRRLVQKHKGGFIARITASGDVDLI